MDRAFRELRHLGKFRQPGCGKAITISLAPMTFCQHFLRDAVLLHRPDQPNTPFDFAVVEHEARSRDLHGGSSRALIDQQGSATIRKTTKSVIQIHRMIALTLGDREKPGLGACAVMDVDRPPAGDRKALGAERFQPDVIDARCDCPFDASGHWLLEDGEQDILKIDRERQ